MSDAGTKQLVAEIAQFITDHKGKDPVVIDVSEQAGWTDFFVVATVMSLGHLKGITRELWSFLKERNVEVFNRHKGVAGDGWELIDCGSIIIHLMSEELRDFYGLEKMWHQGEKVDFLKVALEDNEHLV